MGKKDWLLLFFIAVAFLIVSSFDYSDEVAEERHYCDMVRAHVWPDYMGIYSTCGEPK